MWFSSCHHLTIIHKHMTQIYFNFFQLIFTWDQIFVSCFSWIPTTAQSIDVTAQECPFSTEHFSVKKLALKNWIVRPIKHLFFDKQSQMKIAVFHQHGETWLVCNAGFSFEVPMRVERIPLSVVWAGSTKPWNCFFFTLHLDHNQWLPISVFCHPTLRLISVLHPTVLGKNQYWHHDIFITFDNGVTWSIQNDPHLLIDGATDNGTAWPDPIIWLANWLNHHCSTYIARKISFASIYWKKIFDYEFANEIGPHGPHGEGQ